LTGIDINFDVSRDGNILATLHPCRSYVGLTIGVTLNGKPIQYLEYGLAYLVGEYGVRRDLIVIRTISTALQLRMLLFVYHNYKFILRSSWLLKSA
jgi:hypothetical protein